MVSAASPACRLDRSARMAAARGALFLKPLGVEVKMNVVNVDFLELSFLPLYFDLWRSHATADGVGCDIPEWARAVFENGFEPCSARRL